MIVALALLNLALSWFVVHTLYALRYARLYYRDRAGVAFNENQPPRYLDFAYLAFTVGMTFQVSDTNITTLATRRTILRHALLSYVLDVLVLPCTVNLVSGLVSQGPPTRGPGLYRCEHWEDCLVKVKLSETLKSLPSRGRKSWSSGTQFVLETCLTVNCLFSAAANSY